MDSNDPGDPDTHRVKIIAGFDPKKHTLMEYKAKLPEWVIKYNRLFPGGPRITDDEVELLEVGGRLVEHRHDGLALGGGLASLLLLGPPLLLLDLGLDRVALPPQGHGRELLLRLGHARLLLLLRLGRGFRRSYCALWHGLLTHDHARGQAAAAALGVRPSDYETLSLLLTFLWWSPF